VFKNDVTTDNINERSGVIKEQQSKIHIIPEDITHTHICRSDEYTRVHWTAQLNDHNEIVEDTRKTYGDDHPIELSLGHFQMTRCLELALNKMGPGDRFKILCPAEFAYGGVSKYYNFGVDPDEHRLIPANSDLIYNVQILSC